MNLGDGLLFELENGKPKLILLHHAVEKNPVKLRCRSRPACVEEVQPGGRSRDGRSKVGGAMASGRRSNGVTSSKLPEHHRGGGVKVKSERHKLSAATATAASTTANGSAGRPQNGRQEEAGQKHGVLCLTNEQLQQILSKVLEPPGGARSPAENQSESKCQSSVKDGKEEKEKEEEEEKDGGGGGVRSSQDDDDQLLSSSRSSGGLLSFLEERRSQSRAAVEARRAQYRRDLDEQLELKQQLKQRPAPLRPQAEEDGDGRSAGAGLRIGDGSPREEVLNSQRREEQRRQWLEELHQQREEAKERRRRNKLLQSQTEDHDLWASHFDSLQRRPPLQTGPGPGPLQTGPGPAPLQTGPGPGPLQTGPGPGPLQTGPGPGPGPLQTGPDPSRGSDWGDREPSSSLSLVWDALSSCGAESVGGASVGGASVGGASVGGASVGGASGTRSSFLRTMTALLDPAQVEERERRRRKQQEQQRAIEAQVEERRIQREQEETRRREEEEEEERRVMMEREVLRRRYELDTLKEKQQEEQDQESPGETGQDQRDDVPSPGSQRQTETASTVQSSADTLNTAPPPPAAPPPPPPAPPPAAAPPAAPLPNIRSRAVTPGKENICLPAGGGGGAAGGAARGRAGGRGRGGGPGGGPGGRGRGGPAAAGGAGGADPYEGFSRTGRSRRRPEWNSLRPGGQFVPASERYPASLQRSRQQSRRRRQAELLALQERTCQSRTTAPPQLLDQRGSSRTSPSETRGRSPPVPAVKPRVQSQRTPPPPILDFVPYVRTAEVFHLDPLEPTDPSPPAPTAPPPAPAGPRDPVRQEILRGLAQLRQGLLQKQKELETDLNPQLP